MLSRSLLKFNNFLAIKKLYPINSKFDKWNFIIFSFTIFMDFYYEAFVKTIKTDHEIFFNLPFLEKQ